jgi:hypothetical protein
LASSRSISVIGAVRPGQLVESFRLDGFLAPVAEIGVVGVVTAELGLQPLPRPACLGQLGARRTRVGSLRSMSCCPIGSTLSAGHDAG